MVGPDIGSDDAHGATLWQRLPSSGRMFVTFWSGAALLGAAAALALQAWSIYLHHRTARPLPPVAMLPVPATHVPVPDTAPGDTAPRMAPRNAAIIPPVRHDSLTIQPPVADMLESVPGDPGYNLPKIGPNGEMPRHVYAAASPVVPPGNARVAIVIEGFGLSDTMSRMAIRILPAPVSFAIPPYASSREALLTAARQSGHEFLLSLPMQPSSAPLDDEGPKALGYDHNMTTDQANLTWALSRLAGYVGVTNAFSGVDGDAFAQSPDFRMVSENINARGLLYLNATPGSRLSGTAAGGTASLRIDTDTNAAGLDAQLQQLVEQARKSGEAIAVTGPIRPVFLDRLAAWSGTLAEQGITLVPVSMLCDHPAPDLQADNSQPDRFTPALVPTVPTHAVSSSVPPVTATPLPPHIGP